MIKYTRSEEIVSSIDADDGDHPVDAAISYISGRYAEGHIGSTLTGAPVHGVDWPRIYSLSVIRGERCAKCASDALGGDWCGPRITVYDILSLMARWTS